VAGETEGLVALAQDAYVWGLYPVVTYETRHVYTQVQPVGVNRFMFHRALSGPEDRRVVTPNATTLYGSAFIDLTGGPFVIGLPTLEDRYFSLQVMDQYGDYFLEAGEPFTGSEARRFVLCGPTWSGELPAQVNMREVITTPSDTVWAILRVAVTDGTEAGLATASAFFDGVVGLRLPDWEQGITDPKPAKGDYPVHPRMTDLANVFRDATAADYFEILDLCLTDPSFTRRTDSVAERDLLARLAEVGIGTGDAFAFGSLDNDTRGALEAGYAAGKEQVTNGFATSFIHMSGGWALGSNWGWFGTDFLRRAIAAGFGWGGAGPHSHTAAFLFKDADGNPLDGSTNRYTMTFPIDALPPVRNHWELPIYDADGFFVANEIDRYSINSYMLDRGDLHVEDRTLTVYVQHQRPTNPAHLPNWLPAPPGKFRFAARFYGPDAPLIDGTYLMPAATLTR
jgi:hypothetical protein